MIAFGIQRLQGFDAPPSLQRPQGLLGLGADELEAYAENQVTDESIRYTTSGSFDALVRHRQWRPAFEVASGDEEGVAKVRFGTAADILGRVAPMYVANHEQARRNAAAVALLNAWLEEDPGGNASDEWAEIQGSIDAERLSGRKLFP
jgi:hypothetical protein